MRGFGRIICFLAFLIVLLPNLGAQDKKDPDKKDPAKADAKVEKKDAEKKDADKKDAKKDDEKKDEDKDKKKESKKAEPEEKVVYGQTITAKLKRMDANSARDFAIEIPVVDPMKVYQVNMWKMNEMGRLMRLPANTPQARYQQAQQMAQFQMQLARKMNTEIQTMKDMDLRAAENCKVRAMFPPIEFDDKGKMKTYTQKELTALRAGSKLRGYPADFDRLNVGQFVTVYLAKPSAPAKGELTKGEAPAKKKNLDDDDAVMARPEAVMIVIEQEAPVQPR